MKWEVTTLKSKPLKRRQRVIKCVPLLTYILYKTSHWRLTHLCIEEKTLGKKRFGSVKGGLK